MVLDKFPQGQQILGLPVSVFSSGIGPFPDVPCFPWPVQIKLPPPPPPPSAFPKYSNGFVHLTGTLYNNINRYHIQIHMLKSLLGGKGLLFIIGFFWQIGFKTYRERLIDDSDKKQ